MTVSVLIPCRNAGPHIDAAVHSALAQHPDEVLVADAGSTDGSGSRAAALGATVFVIGDVGQAAARNFLSRQAAGEWVQWLDADDFLLPDKIERQLAASTDVDATYCDFEIVGPDGVTIRKLARLTPWSAAMRHQSIQVGSYLTRADVARAVPFDPAFDNGGSDAKWAVDLTAAGVEFRHVPFVGCAWRSGWSDAQTTAHPDPTVHRRLVRSSPIPKELLVRELLGPPMTNGPRHLPIPLSKES